MKKLLGTWSFGVLLTIAMMLLMQNKVFAAGEIRIRETDTIYDSLAAAIAVAPNPCTIEVAGDITVTSNLTITTDVTIVGVQGAHKITMPTPYSIFVHGGSLTLGDGTKEDHLTISSVSTTVKATGGLVKINDGIAIISTNSCALNLDGADVTATIRGGSLSGVTSAIDMNNGAVISEISGGTLTGTNDVVHLSDENQRGTSIDKISGGSFYQTSTASVLHGYVLYIQNNAQIGEISGGYFEAARSGALCIVRGGWVETISGGNFVLQNASDNARRLIQIAAPGKYGATGIGTISGGHFSGGWFGIWISNAGASNEGDSQIGSITGGVFESGNVALQNDVGGAITEVSGGTFTAQQGMLNAGIIQKIGGQVEVTGTSTYSIYNYNNYGRIYEISGGTFISTPANQPAVVNLSTISRISGGTFIGGLHAIDCIGVSAMGKIDIISGGVFWGKSSHAIRLAQSLELEPGLNTMAGAGRYWAGNGQIFYNEQLVSYPVNAQINSSYAMSSTTETVSVAGIADVTFRYLWLPNGWSLAYDANIPNGAEGSENILPNDQIILANNAAAMIGSPIEAPTREGGTYVFVEWNTAADGTGTPFQPTDVVPPQAFGTTIVLYAQWKWTEVSAPPEPPALPAPLAPPIPAAPMVPKTDDSGNWVGWLFALLASAWGTAALLVWRKQRKKGAI